MCVPSMAPITLSNSEILWNLVFVFNKRSPFGQDIISADMEFKALTTLLTQWESDDFPKSNLDPTDLEK